MSDDRRSVKTYVPADQKAIWQDHADELGMSQSEFVRTMVQAGRRGFKLDPEQPGSDDATPGVEGFEDRVLDLLSEQPLDWDELLDELAGDIEERLDETLERLQSRNRVQYSGREGGYTVVGGDDGS